MPWVAYTISFRSGGSETIGIPKFTENSSLPYVGTVANLRDRERA